LIVGEPVIVSPVVVAMFQILVAFPVIVHVPLPIFKVLVPVPEQLNVCIVGLLLFTEKSKVIPIAPQVKEVILKSVATVIVPVPLLASIVTVSLAPGTDAPPEPPEDVLQFVVVELSHVPPFPTQKRDAI